jgi:chromosome segregation ATPase
MNEKNYEKRLNFQKEIISRKSSENQLLKQEIERLNQEIEKLNQKLKDKDEIIHSIEPLRREMEDNIKEHRIRKNEYKDLIEELKLMKEIYNQEVYQGRWKLVKPLIKFLIK